MRRQAARERFAGSGATAVAPRALVTLAWKLLISIRTISRQRRPYKVCVPVTVSGLLRICPRLLVLLIVLRAKLEGRRE